MTGLHESVLRMYALIAGQVGRPPRVFRCPPGEVDRMRAIMADLELRVTVEADRGCDENLGYYVEPG